MTEPTVRCKWGNFLDTIWPCRKAVRAIHENTQVTEHLNNSVEELNTTLIDYNTRMTSRNSEAQRGS